MKIHLFACSVLLLGSGCGSLETPSLVGVWHDNTASFHHKSKGFVESHVGGLKMVIEEQHKHIFKGYKEWVVDDIKKTETFSGVISADNKQLYIAEHKTGMNIGDIQDRNKLIIYYLEFETDESMASWHEFVREK